MAQPLTQEDIQNFSYSTQVIVNGVLAELSVALRQEPWAEQLAFIQSYNEFDCETPDLSAQLHLKVERYAGERSDACWFRGSFRSNGLLIAAFDSQTSPAFIRIAVALLRGQLDPAHRPN